MMPRRWNVPTRGEILEQWGQTQLPCQDAGGGGKGEVVAVVAAAELASGAGEISASRP